MWARWSGDVRTSKIFGTQILSDPTCTDQSPFRSVSTASAGMQSWSWQQSCGYHECAAAPVDTKANTAQAMAALVTDLNIDMVVVSLG
jgi:hypothetical protein